MRANAGGELRLQLLELNYRPSVERKSMSTVKAILEQKGSEVWSIGPEDTVYDAVQRMSEREVGALLVMNGDVLVGIITERDYARKIILEGRASNATMVKDVMTRDVLCVSPDRSLSECMALMTDKRARHLPVIENHRVVGLISIGDLVKSHIDDQNILIDQLQHYISG